MLPTYGMESGQERVALVPAVVALQPLSKSAGQLAPLSTMLIPVSYTHLKKPCDLELLDQVFVRFSELIADQPWIKELDINPMLATPTDIIALDARVVLHLSLIPICS